MDSAESPTCLGRLLILPKERQFLTCNSWQKSLSLMRQVHLYWMGTVIKRKRRVSTKQESYRVSFINFLLSYILLSSLIQGFLNSL